MAYHRTPTAPGNPRRRLLPRGPVTWLIALNAAVFLAVWGVILAGNLFGLKGNFTMPWLCVPSDTKLFLGRPWTAVTYMVTQYDFLHLLFNVLWLYCFATVLASGRASRHVLALYAGGGLAGAAAWLGSSALLNGGEATGSVLCGASAAVLAVMAGAAMTEPRRQIDLFLLGPVQLRWLALACFLLAFLGFGSGSRATQAAHVGGALFGLIYGLTLMKRPRHRPVSSPEAGISPRRKFRINVRRNGNAVADAMARRPSDQDRLDQLLDKIRNSGYPSLTLAERNELNLLSQRLDKDKPH